MTIHSLLATQALSVEALSTVLYVVGLAITSAIGIITLWLILRHYRRAEKRLGSAL